MGAEPLWRERVDRLEARAPDLYGFLRSLEGHTAADERGITLGTNLNAHVYKDGAYVLRIEVEDAAIVLQKKFHAHIKDGAPDCSEAFMNELHRALSDAPGVEWLEAASRCRLDGSTPGRIYGKITRVLKGFSRPGSDG